MSGSEFLDVHVGQDDDDGVWFIQFADGEVHDYPSEDSACRAQRLWRRAHGRHPITGASMDGISVHEKALCDVLAQLDDLESVMWEEAVSEIEHIVWTALTKE